MDLAIICTLPSALAPPAAIRMGPRETRTPGRFPSPEVLATTRATTRAPTRHHQSNQLWWCLADSCAGALLVSLHKSGRFVPGNTARRANRTVTTGRPEVAAPLLWSNLYAWGNAHGRPGFFYLVAGVGGLLQMLLAAATDLDDTRTPAPTTTLRP